MPVESATGWAWKPPSDLLSNRMSMWWVDMGVAETWPTEFNATLVCDGYRPWIGRVRSESSLHPSIDIEATVEKL